MKEIRVGKGSAQLVPWDENSIYEEITLDSVYENLELEMSDLDDLVWLENLSNGGEKGAGLKVLKEALRVARAEKSVLMVFANSDSDQQKLIDWYLDTGLLVQVPTVRGTRLAAILMDKQSPLKVRTTPLEDDL
jgi:hypothetical protein